MNCKSMMPVVLVWLLLAGASFAAPPGKKWAVVVGVDQYQRSSVSNLKFAVSDAQLFADALVTNVGLPKEQVFLYTSNATSATEQPRLTNLVYRLEWLNERVSEEDTLFFYFAGHGVETDGKAFLLMDNADNRSLATLGMSSLKADLLFDLLAQCRAKDTLVILDACRNDPVAGRGSQDNPLTESMSRGLVFKPEETSTGGTAVRGRNLATLFACGLGERSYEWPEKGHGYFTYYLVEGLKGASGQANGAITLAGLAGYVRDQVSQVSGRTGESQQPTLRYEGPGPEGWVLAASQRTGNGETELSADAKLQNALRENAALRAENERLKKQLENR